LIDRAQRYAKDVISGKTKAGPIVRGACHRHFHDLEKAKSDSGFLFKYNKKKASEAIRFFEEYLLLNGGQFEGKPFILLPWQAFIIGSIFGWVKKKNGFRRFKVAYIETPKGPLALDTPIATKNGWSVMGDIKIGDFVFNSHGELTKVTGVSETFYNRDCYRVSFSDGESIICDGEHEWVVVSRFGGYGKKINTSYIAKTYKMTKSNSNYPQTKWNYSVGNAPPLILSDMYLPANLADEPKSRPLSKGRMIVGCEPVASVPVKCITIASNDHLFLAGKHLVPTCNSGKSPLAAGVGLKGLVADKEPRAEIYAAATYKDQAMVLFRDAVAFYDQSPKLQELLISSGTGSMRWNLAYLEKGSFFRVISSEKKGQSGPRPHVVLLDEIHEHKDGTVIEMLRAGFKFRQQPLSFMITNSGNNKTSVCWEYHEMGEKIACEQLQNDEFFAYICGLDEEDLKDDKYLLDENLWAKANPSLDYGLPGYEYIRGQVMEAKGMPSKMATVKRLCFCQWTESENPAISRDVWMGCQDKAYDVDILKGRKCWGGLDLSAVNDLTAFALMFEPNNVDPFWRLKVWFWVPGIGLVVKSDYDHVPYIAWRDAGYVTAINKKSIEYDFVIVDIKDLSIIFDIQKIAFDRWNIKFFNKDLERLGIELPELVEFGQGYKSMSPAIKVFEKKLLDSNIRHDGNPCLTWNVSNVVADEDAADNKKYIKPSSGARIDGVIAAVMACGILEENATQSAYDGLTEAEIIKRMAL